MAFAGVMGDTGSMHPLLIVLLVIGSVTAIVGVMAALALTHQR